MPNHYATLDLPTNASAAEIKKYVTITQNHKIHPLAHF
jgi:hypothetical protein